MLTNNEKRKKKDQLKLMEKTGLSLRKNKISGYYYDKYELYMIKNNYLKLRTYQDEKN